MEPVQWLSLAAVCLLGAMSPGPSTAVVLNAAISGGRSAGITAAIAHGMGVGLYGLLTVTGLAVVVTRSPALFVGIQLAGAAYLVYLGVKALRSTGSVQPQGQTPDTCRGGAATSGFLVAFLNPKLAVFMLALFAQFLQPEAPPAEKALMAATVWFTDTLWYLFIALLVSHAVFYERLRARARLIDRCFGVILILLALSVVYRALA
jgi:threonine/homoserine/homoserine lactone efflux protein